MSEPPKRIHPLGDKRSTLWRRMDDGSWVMLADGLAYHRVDRLAHELAKAGWAGRYDFEVGEGYFGWVAAALLLADEG